MDLHPQSTIYCSLKIHFRRILRCLFSPQKISQSTYLISPASKSLLTWQSTDLFGLVLGVNALHFERHPIKFELGSLNHCIKNSTCVSWEPNTMISGDGAYSYSKNSTFQKYGISCAMEQMTEALKEALDVQSMLSSGSSSSRLFTIADLGCSVGPNTFFAIETIISAVTIKYRSQGLDPKSIEFQVFFNDQTSNDFNMLFASLPDHKDYLVAAVPGSFYEKLFPTSTIHIAYSSTSLHWMSRLPKELQDEKSPAWNKGRIHYIGAPEAVVRAYFKQFEADMDAFFKERAREVVPGGLVIVLMPGVPDGVLVHEGCLCLTFLESILMDMVAEGLLDQHKVDSFNFPAVYPSEKELRNAVEKNGCFKIVRMELMRNVFQTKEDDAVKIDMDSGVRHIRATVETTLASHLGHEIVQLLFTRAFQQKDKLYHMMSSAGTDLVGGQLFAVLQRK